MMKERPDRCFTVHAELLFPAPVCVVFIVESTVPSIHRDNTAVRDGGSEGIPRKVAYGVPHAVEGFLYKWKPAFFEHTVHKRFPPIPGLQVFSQRKVQPAIPVILLKGTEKYVRIMLLNMVGTAASGRKKPLCLVSMNFPSGVIPRRKCIHGNGDGSSAFAPRYAARRQSWVSRPRTSGRRRT